MPFDRILDVVGRGEVDAGVVIHEGQLTYGDEGLQRCAISGAWWQEETGGPLPLGANGIRKDLDRSSGAPLPAADRERRLCPRQPAEALGYASATPAVSRTIRCARTSSSACTSTTGRRTTASRARAVQLLLDRGTRPASSAPGGRVRRPRRLTASGHAGCTGLDGSPGDAVQPKGVGQAVRPGRACSLARPSLSSRIGSSEANSASESRHWPQGVAGGVASVATTSAEVGDARRDRLHQRRPLGADGQPVGPVLDVAAAEHAAVSRAERLRP